MALNFFFLIVLGVAVVGLTRLVVRGIELYAASGGMSSKTKGKFLGYATSLPELVGTVGTAGHGLLGAGLWNIAASNVINWVLFLGASLYYSRLRAVARRKFADELTFAALAFCVPLVLSRFHDASRSPWTAGCLFAFFLAYLYIDQRLNPNPPPSVAVRGASRSKRGKSRAIGLAILGVIGIVAAGNYLGLVAEVIVKDLGVPEWAIGWVLGFITSLPEMTAFFAVYASAKEVQHPDDDTDCQENIDGLCASNMSNLGIIYPLGIAVFLSIGM